MCVVVECGCQVVFAQEVNMGDRLKAKVAIVTGAGRGIGRGEALLLAAEGAAVVVNDPGVNSDGTGHDNGPADQVVAEIKARGGQAVANHGDVSSFQDGETMVQQALDAFGRLDILVNNAGILRDRMVFNMTEQEWDAVIAVHLKGHFNVTRCACVIFRQQRNGRIVNTSSTSGLGNMGQANYSAAKEGIVGLTRTVARDMGRYGVTCNAIRPTAGTRLTVNPQMEAARAKATDTGMRDASLPTGEDIAKMDPEAIAPLVTYLCTDEASYLNGRIFYVRGNQVGTYPEPEPVRTIFASGPRWTLDQLVEVVPLTIGFGMRNEWAPQEQ
jgi:NAD(P)-dependent dehydrogenase (short-subunit alcohol dehydrogenase family)